MDEPCVCLKRSGSRNVCTDLDFALQTMGCEPALRRDSLNQAIAFPRDVVPQERNDEAYPVDQD